MSLSPLAKNHCFESPLDLGNPQVLLAWQRNHLANERTFLAWVRTGLSLFVFSFVIERFDFFLRQARILGEMAGLTAQRTHTEVLSASVFLSGVLVVGVAMWRFLRTRRSINAGAADFSLAPNLVFMLLVAGVVGGLAAVFWTLILS